MSLLLKSLFLFLFTSEFCSQRHAQQRPAEDDGLFSRPIIKEEDLKQMDEIVRDNGWATADDIDYK